MFSKVIQCLEQNIRKQIDCKSPSNTKQIKRVDYKIFIIKYANRNISKRGFASTNLALNYIKQV